VRRIHLSILFVALTACREGAAPSTTAPATPTSASVAAGDLVIGAPAPDFSVTAHDGTLLQLSALKGRHVVLYFYPKDETPGCTKEACSFRDAWKELAATGSVLIGVSMDSLESHRGFAEHHQLPFHLVSDADGSIARAYGVPQRYRAMNGIEYTGILARQTIVIGPDGRVKRIHRTVDVATHAQEVLADVH
jgi:peroxiredoxin Q/BCP